jgi:hypothetical protein
MCGVRCSCRHVCLFFFVSFSLLGRKNTETALLEQSVSHEQWKRECPSRGQASATVRFGARAAQLESCSELGTLRQILPTLEYSSFKVDDVSVKYKFIVSCEFKPNMQDVHCIYNILQIQYVVNTTCCITMQHPSVKAKFLTDRQNAQKFAAAIIEMDLNGKEDTFQFKVIEPIGASLFLAITLPFKLIPVILPRASFLTSPPLLSRSLFVAIPTLHPS